VESTSLPAASILDHLGTGVLICDAHLQIESINVAAQSALNISLMQALGQPLGSLGHRASQLVTTAKRALDSKKRFTEHAVQLGPDGHQSRVDLHFTPLDHENSDRLLIELIPVERQLALADAEQSAQHQAAMQALLRGLAHEIKNPLGGLRGAAQLMDRELEDRELRQYTRVIIDEADRLAELLDRFQRPASQPLHQPVNVHRALERVRQLSAAQYASQMSVDTDYDPSIPDVVGDLDRLVQGLLNLANNAAEAGASRLILSTRIRRHLSLGGSSNRSALSIDFIDNGCGVDEALRDLVFYPLVSGRSEGSGLGLSIAQTIAAEHGGQIICRSSPGHTVFSWLLPVNLDESSMAGTDEKTGLGKAGCE
jgi:two-component system nitrogen regulation sensor histidine kinase GlnL